METTLNDGQPWMQIRGRALLLKEADVHKAQGRTEDPRRQEERSGEKSQGGSDQWSLPALW